MAQSSEIRMYWDAYAHRKECLSLCANGIHALSRIYHTFGPVGVSA